MYRYRKAAFTALFSLAISTGANAQDCWRGDEAIAARVNGVQIALMVEALKCQNSAPDTLAAYNHFMDAKRPLIIESKHILEGHFVHLYGPHEGLAAAANYETRVGNKTSFPDGNDSHCTQAAALARMAATASRDDLAVLADVLGENGALPTCRTGDPREAASLPQPDASADYRDPKPTAFAATADAPEAATVGDDQPAPAELASAQMIPADPLDRGEIPAIDSPAPAPIVTPAVATATPAPVPTPADTAKVLEAAAQALSQAATALKASAAAAPATQTAAVVAN